IDGRGKFLMPGLADMHVHTWSEQDFPLFLANGVTTVRNMFGAPVHLDWRRRIAAGELLGPTIVTAGPIVDGKRPVWPGSDVVADAEDAERVVAAQKEAGYDFVKVYSKLTKTAYDAVVASAKKHGLPVDGHVPDAVGVEAVLASGQRSLEHLSLYGIATSARAESSKDMLAIADFAAWTRFDADKGAALAKATAKSGIWSCPTIVVLQKWVSEKDAEELSKRPEMRYCWMRAMWKSGFGSSKDSRMEEIAASMPKANEARKKMTGLLHAAGARLILGTDMGNPWVVPGFSAHEELRNLVDSGLSPFEALRAATSSPAEMLGVPGEFGTVAAGARADLVLLDADPLADVANAQRVSGVMARGRWLPRADLQAKLDAIAESLGAPASSPK
ncbi:MAG TPA: amidohydrolase family protein, partial [Planctomycetota bacterium]|nr:amidohydrolase family protein [Planctomycetota bacterium]